MSSSKDKDESYAALPTPIKPPTIAPGKPAIIAPDTALESPPEIAAPANLWPCVWSALDLPPLIYCSAIPPIIGTALISAKVPPTLPILFFIPRAIGDLSSIDFCFTIFFCKVDALTATTFIEAVALEALPAKLWNLGSKFFIVFAVNPELWAAAINSFLIASAA